MELARMDLREVKARADRTEALVDKDQAVELEALLAAMQVLVAKEPELEAPRLEMAAPQPQARELAQARLQPIMEALQLQAKEQDQVRLQLEDQALHPVHQVVLLVHPRLLPRAQDLSQLAAQWDAQRTARLVHARRRSQAL